MNKSKHKYNIKDNIKSLWELKFPEFDSTYQNENKDRKKQLLDFKDSAFAICSNYV
jgi:hypothetical protein